MSLPAPRRVAESVVRLDHGQFCLCGNPSPDADYMALLEQAINGPGIAADDTGVIVISPHQNNFEMPLRLELWDARPPDDHDAWEEVFEAGLLVVDDLLRYFSPTDTVVNFEVPSGRYAARISGQGFVNRGWPGSITPGDRWRVRLWPAADTFPERRLKEWRHPGA
ncbi:hypothetical protein QLQ12_10355 [Actinoplanes sp. NEAU-A12]|uniref:Uncharacterized protein n=1 Tax=Actinoplanes sandaracinus TaxID=3045177 RepID=A0ABT6WGZ8_9ACTN|nr:hypothetical protein [Actinoplanes sandaracinus]MDI6099001.1 hypothetical protein [Actinoplanes sandaracinus]